MRSLSRHHVQILRRFSSSSTSSSSSSPPPRSTKVTPLYLLRKKRLRQPITTVTAYDYPSSVHANQAGIDIILVGDSCAMVELGHATTQTITLDEMLHHCRAVHRGVSSPSTPSTPPPLLVGDMPLGTYEINDDEALRHAYRLVQEGHMDAVKLEGGSPRRAATVRRLVRDGGVAVIGHVGLTPQAVSALGGFVPQGRTARSAVEILDGARRLRDAGAAAVVLECVPAHVARVVTEELEDLPTIGIGAGPYCDGQVLVFHDMLGMMNMSERQRQRVPKFVKAYGDVGSVIQEGLRNYKRDVEERVFPGDGQHSPYHMSDEEARIFDEIIQQQQQQHYTANDEPIDVNSHTNNTITSSNEKKTGDNDDDHSSSTLYGN